MAEILYLPWLSYAMEQPAQPQSLFLVFYILLLGSMLWAIRKPKRIRAWAYLFNGPSIVHCEYQKSRGQPFEIYAPDVRMVFVSSREHIKELDNAPDAVLSLNGAAKHMLQPVYTMNGFNWFDRRGVEGVGFVRTLRTLLTNNIPQLLPDLGVLTRTCWAELLSKQETIDGTTLAPVYPMMMNLVVLLNGRSLFGEELIKSESFTASALGYVEETLLNAEIVKLFPKPFAPFVGGLLGYFLNSHKTFFESLIPMTEQRVKERDDRNLGRTAPERADCIQWIMETAPKQNPWSAERVIYELMAIWFGSVHILTTTIVYVIHDLCLHPEYIEPLRYELDTSYQEFERTGQGLPLLDSFIKESARLTPVESMSVRRCALQPFSLSDGTKVGVGEWACAPSGAINTSAEYYHSPEEFSGFRFVDPTILSRAQGASVPAARQSKSSRLTDVEHSFLVWGTGRMACPGRYYASAFMKLVIA
ncbi:cytochrome P450 [Durotheca rogersii]|uniref:cytochrome P450 n=1 Tax=Durotheca rogersii TaxID=419775 RepID=UPI00221F84C0|nr:cytochrome P450 [Durotheca rogersii]KAI5868246.1 cytochrome P450 [Durotheca rogersii]